MEKVFSIAIDGPAGAGKSTVARAVAAKLDALYLDTGAMYRAAGLHLARQRVALNDAQAVRGHIAGIPLRVAAIDGVQHTFLGDEDVSQAIRAPEISKAASAISSIPEVRARLVEMQREIALGQSVVMDGRDIGTKVLPNATLKIFLTAKPEIRAQRRWEELRAKGVEEPFEKVYEELVQRDYDDSHRAASPMVMADDAVEVDTSDMSFEQVVERVVSLARAAAEGKA